MVSVTPPASASKTIVQGLSVVSEEDNRNGVLFPEKPFVLKLGQPIDQGLGRGDVGQHRG